MRKNLLRTLAPCAMTFLAARTLLWRGSTIVRASEVSSFGSSARAHSLSQFRGGQSHATADNNAEKVYRTLQVQIVHRHGDRTPITPLKDEDFWASTLIPQDLLDKISTNTNVITTPGQKYHVAMGRGPFGKLTQLGLFQLVDLGTRLREELVSDKPHHDLSAYQLNAKTNTKVFPYPWHPERPLTPSNIKVISTNFPRTIQSVQGLLVGLFPDGTPGETIDIDARNTDTFIPDPQPRRTPEQVELESQLSKIMPHLKQRDLDLKPIAIRMTEALKETLGEGALGVSYGVGEEADDGDTNKQPVLSWAQLSEIIKCLEVRDKMLPTISKEDREAIASHTAWRWFEALRHPRLIYLAMSPMANQILDSMHQHADEPPVIVYSAHDSTLIGLLCSFRLEKPIVWPEYGSYLKIELMEVSFPTSPDNKQHVVRFSLNGDLLRSVWEDEEDQEPLVEIPLEVLAHKIRTVGAMA